MNSLIFTKTPFEKKKPIIYGTNNKGQYYSNEKIIIHKIKPIYNEETRFNELLRSLRVNNFIIENIYQEKYGEVNASGFGDFLRGSYFLMQFCDKYNFSFYINMLNHPIYQFLDIYTNKQSSTYSDIYLFGITNFKPIFLDDNILSNEFNPKINKTFTHFLNICASKNKNKNKNVVDNKIYTYIISYPEIPILQKHKLYMQKLLKPTSQFLSIINNTLDQLGLIIKKFIVIHIRYGDCFLLNNEENIDSEHLKIIDNAIELLEPNQQPNILLISDNTIIKNIIVKKYPFVKTHFNEITHTGEGTKIQTDALQNTMLDFYLFSMAEKIFAFSVYNHGSGFSKWAAETYSIPYVCRFLK